MNLETSKTKKEYFSHLRHELRTPLNAIIGYSGMLIEDAQDMGLNEYIPMFQEMISLGNKLNDTIQHVLYSSAMQNNPDKVDTGTLKLDIKNGMAPNTQRAIDLAKKLIEKSNNEDQTDFIDDLDKIEKSGMRLMEMINSISQSTAPKSQSNALPAKSKQAEMYSGVINAIQSTANKDEEDEANGFILVVDDNELNRDVLSRHLMRQGHRVDVAENGVIALEKLRKNDFDLVLLDVMMPELDGIQTLEEMKNDPALSFIPVIMLSAVQEMEKVAQCIEMGAEEFLPKPADRILLRARINATLEKKRLRDREVMYLHQIEEEKQHSEALLRVILPEEVVHELKTTNEVKPRRYENVGVIFADIVGFTPYCEANSPETVVSHLQGLVELFEEISSQFNLEKIKTIGDSYMAAAGLLEPVDNPTENCVRAGLAMVEAAKQINEEWQVRVGIHSGPVIAGVVGKKKYLFDLWGDTVNTASRVESYGLPSSVHISKKGWDEIESIVTGNSRGLVEIRGKGQMELFHVESIKDQ